MSEEYEGTVMNVTSRYAGSWTPEPVSITAVDGGFDIIAPNGEIILSKSGYIVASFEIGDHGVVTYRLRRHPTT